LLPVEATSPSSQRNTRDKNFPLIHDLQRALPAHFRV